ncbi:CDP-alcohol phosphatidyltransferase family protein [Ruania halotolerans]|uniref:CDP-alcohol phosphatidyltransferase family protein n=1 Tax=Ruania halotolerans TaxID=2897773 RepID=UPI001E4A7E9D|nr:CDP-alcohol phosphatidyltransferase family protein [Ruania halotolerans]UFU08234.1 CDP-alcohol phosphatidyltransferase family protein [Ruania halotolerans]
MSRIPGGENRSEPVVTDRIFTVPNVISMVRLLLVPVVGVLIMTGHLIPAFVVLVGAGFSDWLDGVIARRFNQTSRLGRFLDPSADRLFILVTILGLAVQQIIPWWVVIVLLARELAVGLCLPAMARRGYPGFPVHVAGKAGTFALMYAFPLLLLSHLSGPVGETAWVVGWAAALWGVFLYWAAGLLYLNQFREVMTGRAMPA